MIMTLDLRGLSCPIPLLKTRDALKDANAVTVVVDELPPKENIIKYANSQNFTVNCTTNSDEYIITIKR
jgi:TusA-related sulfurtransferase